MGLLPYHERPVRQHSRSRFTRPKTPYHFTIGEAGSWRIGFGASSFLIANGSGFSIPIGRKMFRQLESDWLLRRKKKLKKVK